MEKRKKSYYQYSGAIALIKGELAEEKVLCSLHCFKQLNLVRNFGSSVPFSDDDSYGIDITVYPVWGGKILLQVKSSFNREDKQKYEEKGIEYIVVPPSMGQEVVDEMVFQLLIKDCRRRMREKKNHYNHYRR